MCTCTFEDGYVAKDVPFADDDLRIQRPGAGAAEGPTIMVRRSVCMVPGSAQSVQCLDAAGVEAMVSYEMPDVARGEEFQMQLPRGFSPVSAAAVDEEEEEEEERGLILEAEIEARMLGEDQADEASDCAPDGISEALFESPGGEE